MANPASRGTGEEVDDDDDDSSSSSDVGEGEFIVESLVGKKIVDGKVLYKVRWKGYEPEEDTWEPRDNLGCAEILADFEAKEARTKSHKQDRSSTPQSISNGKKRKHSKSDSDSSDDDQSAAKARKVGGSSKEVEKEKKKKGRPSNLAGKYRSSLGGASASGSGTFNKPGANLKNNMEAFKKKNQANASNSRASSVDSSSSKQPSQKTQWGPKSAHKPTPIQPNPQQTTLLKGLKFKKHDEVAAAMSQGEGEGEASRASSASLGAPVGVASGSGSGSVAMPPQPKPKQKRKPKITIAEDEEEAELYSEDSMHPDYEVPISKKGMGVAAKKVEPTPPIAGPSTTAPTTTQAFVELVIDSPSGRSKPPAQRKDATEADDEEEEDDEDDDESEAVHARLTSKTPSPSKGKSKSTSTPTANSHASPLGKVLSAHQPSSPSTSSSTPFSLPIDLRAKRESPVTGPFSIFTHAPSLLGGGDRKGLGGSTLPPPASSPAVASDPRVKVEVKKEGSSLLSASGIKSAIASALPGSSSSRSSSADEKKAAKMNNSSADLEKKLRKSDFYQKHKKVFEGKDGKNLAVACAEVLQMDGDLILSLRGRRCAITTAANGAFSSTHDAENWALGILLLKAGAELPKSVADIEVVFMHRQHTFAQLASSLVDLTTRSGPYVHFYEFGLDKPVGTLLPSGWAVLPTLSALQNEADVNAMLLTKKRFPGVALAIHPATVCLARSRSNKALADAVVGLIDRKSMIMLSADDLPKESRWYPVSREDVLRGQNIPEVTIENEFSDIETTLYHLRETQRDKYRRFVLLSERNFVVLREKCLKNGVQMTSWSKLEQTISTNIF